MAALRVDDPAVRRQAAEAFNIQGYRFDANEHLRALAKLVPLRPNELWSLLHPAESYQTIGNIPDIQSPAGDRIARRTEPGPLAVFDG